MVIGTIVKYRIEHAIQVTTSMAAPRTQKKQNLEEGNPVTLAYLIAYNVAQILGYFLT